MVWMNEYEIDSAYERNVQNFTMPNLGSAIVTLARLKAEVNSRSDGWAHWQKPARAADRLMSLVKPCLEWRGGVRSDVEDISDADLKKALTPIKAFMTRQGWSQETRAHILVTPAPTPNRNPIVAAVIERHGRSIVDLMAASLALFCRTRNEGLPSHWVARAPSLIDVDSTVGGVYWDLDMEGDPNGWEAMLVEAKTEIDKMIHRESERMSRA